MDDEALSSINSSIRRSEDAEEVERRAQIPPRRTFDERAFDADNDPLWFIEYPGKKRVKPCAFRPVFYNALERQLSEIDARSQFSHLDSIENFKVFLSSNAEVSIMCDELLRMHSDGADSMPFYRLPHLIIQSMMCVCQVDNVIYSRESYCGLFVDWSFIRELDERDRIQWTLAIDP